MKCSQCGHDMPEFAAFCTHCGKNLRAAADALERASPSVLPAESPPAVQQNPVYPPSYPAQPLPVETTPPRRRKTWVPIVAVIIGLLLIGGLVFGLTQLLGNKQNLAEIEQRSIKENSASIAELLSLESLKNAPDKGGTQITAKVTLGSALPIDPQIAEAVKNIAVNMLFAYDRSAPQTQSYTSVDLLGKNDKKALKLEVFTEKERIVIGAPGVLDKYVTFNLKELTEQFVPSLPLPEGSPAINPQAIDPFAMFKFDPGVTKEDVQTSLNNFAKTWSTYADKAEKTRDQATVSAGSLSVKYDAYEVALNDEEVRKWYIALLTEAKNDTTIRKYVGGIGKMLASNGAQDTVDTGKFTAEIDKVISDIQNKTDKKVSIKQTVYVDSKKNVRGRVMVIRDETAQKETGRITYLNPIAGDKQAYLIKFEGSEIEQPMQFMTEFTDKDDKVTGTFDVQQAGKSIVSGSFKDLAKKKIGSRNVILGEMSIKPAEGGEIPAFTLSLKGSEENGKYALDIGVPSFLTIHLTTSEIKASDVVIGTYDANKLVSVADENALASLLTPETQQNLMQAAEDLGLSFLLGGE